MENQMSVHIFRYINIVQKILMDDLLHGNLMMYGLS
jgi:hypothetical protein